MYRIYNIYDKKNNIYIYKLRLYVLKGFHTKSNALSNSNN